MLEPSQVVIDSKSSLTLPVKSKLMNRQESIQAGKEEKKK